MDDTERMMWRRKNRKTVAEAIAMLEKARPCATEAISRLNKSFTKRQAFDIFWNSVISCQNDGETHVPYMVTRNIEREFGVK